MTDRWDAVGEPDSSLPEESENAAPASDSQAGASSGAPEADQSPLPDVGYDPAQLDIEPQLPETASATAMPDVFSDEYVYLQAKRGEIRQAQVIAVRGDGLVVDLGLKHEGLVPAYDVQRVGSDAAESVAVGDEIPVYIVRPEDRDGNIIVSWYRARQEQDWLDAQKLLENGGVWEGEIKGSNRGGLIVPFGKIRGFVPASHITGISRRMNQEALQERLENMVGQTLPLKVLEVNRQTRRLILSERVARREWRAQRREELLTDLQEGDRVHGVVSNICDFGVFVDIGGTDGLVHISELSWRRADHPSELVNIGQEVDAYVLRVDREHKRIGLSLRMLEEDPWEQVEQKYHVGQLVAGLVTKLADFGAFAVLDDGIEGLIHISELAEIPPTHPSEVVSRGAIFPLVVVKIDARRRRMGLSLKRVSEDDWYQWQRDHQATTEEPEEPLAPGEVPDVYTPDLTQPEPSLLAATDQDIPDEEAPSTDEELGASPTPDTPASTSGEDA